MEGIITMKDVSYPLYINRDSKQSVKDFKEAIYNYILAEDTDSEDILSLQVQLARIGQVIEDLKKVEEVKSQAINAFYRKKDPKEASITIQGAEVSVGSTSLYKYDACAHPIIDFLGKANKDHPGWLGDIERMTSVIENELKSIPEETLEPYEGEDEEGNPTVLHKSVGGRKNIQVTDDLIRPLNFIAGRLVDFIKKLESEKLEVVYTIRKAECNKSTFLKISKK